MARFAIALVALLIPTFLMGGTLPLLVHGVVSEHPGLGKVTSRLYGINTLGAMLGTLLAGFAALLTQHAWIRAMILLVGGSVYAFTITLAGFLAGIGVGSLAYTWLFSRRISNQTWPPLQHAALVAGAADFAILPGIPLLAKLPEWFLAGYAAPVAVGRLAGPVAQNPAQCHECARHENGVANLRTEL